MTSSFRLLEVRVHAQGLTPILNVSSFADSVAWFEKLGWRMLWDWGDPPFFGAVGSGRCEIFLCQGAQGGRGRGSHRMTFGPDGDESGDGLWYPAAQGFRPGSEHEAMQRFLAGGHVGSPQEETTDA